MIKRVFQIDEYLNFVDELSCDCNFSDPHFIYDENTLWNAFDRANQIVLATFDGDVCNGIFVVMAEPTESYAEVLIALSKEEKAYEEFLHYLQNSYCGYLIDFVVNPNNYLMTSKLLQKGAEFEVEQLKMLYDGSNKRVVEAKDVVLYEDKYKLQYLAMHSKNLYWTADKVLNALDRFRVLLALEKEEVVGYLDITHCFAQNEPYDLFLKEGYPAEIKEQLLLEAIRLNGDGSIMVLVDVTDGETIQIYESVGFAAVKNQNSVTVHWKNI